MHNETYENLNIILNSYNCVAEISAKVDNSFSNESLIAVVQKREELLNEVKERECRLNEMTPGWKKHPAILNKYSGLLALIKSSLIKALEKDAFLKDLFTFRMSQMKEELCGHSNRAAAVTAYAIHARNSYY
jgi:hypothetical protein